MTEPDPLIWYELAAKYDVPEFYADPLPEPSFETTEVPDLREAEGSPDSGD